VFVSVFITLFCSFSTTVFSLNKDLLCFLRNVTDSFDKVCNFSLYNFNYMGQIVRPSSNCFSYYLLLFSIHSINPRKVKNLLDIEKVNKTNKRNAISNNKEITDFNEVGSKLSLIYVIYLYWQVVGEVANCFAMWFLWRSAQTRTEVQQRLVYTAQ
jgi:hypothetical protein